MLIKIFNLTVYWVIPFSSGVGQQNMSFKSYFSLLPLEHNRLTKHGKSLSWPCLATRGKKKQKSRYVRMRILKISFTMSSNDKVTTEKCKHQSYGMAKHMTQQDSPPMTSQQWKINDSFTHIVLHVHCRVIVLRNLTMFMKWGYIITIQSPVATNLGWTTKVNITGEFHILYSAMLIWGTSKLLGRVVQSWVKITQV